MVPAFTRDTAPASSYQPPASSIPGGSHVYPSSDPPLAINIPYTFALGSQLRRSPISKAWYGPRKTPNQGTNPPDPIPSFWPGTHPLMPVSPVPYAQPVAGSRWGSVPPLRLAHSPISCSSLPSPITSLGTEPPSEFGTSGFHSPMLQGIRSYPPMVHSQGSYVSHNDDTSKLQRGSTWRRMFGFGSASNRNKGTENGRSRHWSDPLPAERVPLYTMFPTPGHARLASMPSTQRYPSQPKGNRFTNLQNIFKNFSPLPFNSFFPQRRMQEKHEPGRSPPSHVQPIDGFLNHGGRSNLSPINGPELGSGLQLRENHRRAMERREREKEARRRKKVERRDERAARKRQRWLRVHER